MGQLHGNQNNICSPSNNTCWCVTQIPSIGEYGRFDISWTGGGTASTRLSDWLDPTNTGATTTTTTDVSNLIPRSLSLSITGGPNQICTGNAAYTINGIPVGLPITVSLSNGNASYTRSGNVVTITKLSDGEVILSVTVGDAACGFTNNTVSKTIKLGAYANYEIQLTGPYAVPLNYGTSFSYDQVKYPNLTNQVWSIPVGTSWYCISGCSSSGYTYAAMVSPSTASTGNVNMTFTSCGVNNIIATKWLSWGYGGPFYRIYPNPASSILNIDPKDTATNKLLTQSSIKLIEIVDKMGLLVYQKKYYTDNSSGKTINISHLKNDVYTVRIFDGKEWKAHKVIIQH